MPRIPRLWRTSRAAICALFAANSLPAQTVSTAKEIDSFNDQLLSLFLQEDAFMQGPRTLQLVVSGEWAEQDAQRTLEIEPELEYGLLDELTLQARVPVAFELPGDTGVTNPSLGLAYAMWRPARLPLRASLLAVSAFASPSHLGEQAFSHGLRAVLYAGLGLLHLQIAPGVELSHGEEVESDPAFGAEGSVAVMLDIGSTTLTAEAALERELADHRYMVASGALIDTSVIDFGAAVQLDLTEKPVTAGLVAMIGGQLDFRR
jgi:hypothetical protein